MNTEQEVAAELTQFIRDEFPLARKQGVDADTSLIEHGIIDSLGILDIVTFIENRFAVILTDEEVVSETFDSIRALSAMVYTKMDQATSISTPQ